MHIIVIKLFNHTLVKPVTFYENMLTSNLVLRTTNTNLNSRIDPNNNVDFVVSGLLRNAFTTWSLQTQTCNRI